MKNIREFEVTHYHNNKRSIKKSTRFFPCTRQINLIQWDLVIGLGSNLISFKELK